MNYKYQLTIAVYNAIYGTDGTGTNKEFLGLDSLFKSIWKNTNRTNGLALTTMGLDYFINTLELEHWEFNVQNVVSADLLMMERYMISPYSLVLGKSKNHMNLVLFEESIAAQLVLYNNDLKMLLSAHDSASDRPVIKR